MGSGRLQDHCDVLTGSRVRGRDRHQVWHCAARPGKPLRRRRTLTPRHYGQFTCLLVLKAVMLKDCSGLIKSPRQARPRYEGWTIWIREGAEADVRAV